MYRARLNAYKDVERKTASLRETEARVLTEGAMKLKRVQENWDAEDRAEMLEAALIYNQKLWTVFQVELGKKDNHLPKGLRINLLKLSTFIDRQIYKVMASPEPQKLTSIININMSIAAGLRGDPGPLGPLAVK